ncbi:hypothetical protein OIU78_006079 [Salix suchowensis]|nr:hypothetical protein OIU78_006079 [Salix suchowensis]
MARLHGDKQGTDYRIWVDRVSSEQVGSDTWRMKFYKWETFGEERHGCLTTVLLGSKAKVPDGFTWMHMHQTWLEGSEPKDQTTWLF